MPQTLPTDVKVKNIELFLIPVETRVPLKFGTETLSSVTCARAKVTVENREGKTAVGWGETPLSVQWVWPSQTPYSQRHDALIEFCKVLQNAWVEFGQFGHALEIGHSFLEEVLHSVQDQFNEKLVAGGGESMPYLAGLVVASVFDQAIHDAYGVLNEIDIYKTYNSQFMSRDLSSFLSPAEGSSVSFEGKFPSDFLVADAPATLPVWHLVGGLDPLSKEELTGSEPDDDYPVLLRDWIERDGLNCLKIKLRGNDSKWDYDRLEAIGKIADETNLECLTADFNCTVKDPEYVNEILDQMEKDNPSVFDKILYVEQPFPYDLEKHRIDVHSVSKRKPLFLDESAHDWKFVKLGLELGWSGVALKTCKTQTGALLSLCWAKAHSMPLMVQDLTNPMLAQVPHVRLAAHAGTIMGVESNGMQFYPDASKPEEAVHPGLYRRRKGILDLSTIEGFGFGYRVDAIERDLSSFKV